MTSGSIARASSAGGAGLLASSAALAWASGERARFSHSDCSGAGAGDGVGVGAGAGAGAGGLTATWSVSGDLPVLPPGGVSLLVSLILREAGGGSAWLPSVLTSVFLTGADWGFSPVLAPRLSVSEFPTVLSGADGAGLAVADVRSRPCLRSLTVGIVWWIASRSGGWLGRVFSKEGWLIGPGLGRVGWLVNANAIHWAGVCGALEELALGARRLVVPGAKDAVGHAAFHADLEHQERRILPA
jgi:hypothetical protein